MYIVYNIVFCTLCITYNWCKKLAVARNIQTAWDTFLLCAKKSDSDSLVAVDKSVH